LQAMVKSFEVSELPGMQTSYVHMKESLYGVWA